MTTTPLRPVRRARPVDVDASIRLARRSKAHRGDANVLLARVGPGVGLGSAAIDRDDRMGALGVRVAPWPREAGRTLPRTRTAIVPAVEGPDWR